MSDTRQSLVYAAMTLFAEKGYNSTSVADILKRAGANSGSLYHFFPGKQDLLIAVLDAYHGGIDTMLLQPAWEGVEDPLDRIFALLAGYREMLVASDFFMGCPIGSLALELHEPDPPVRERLQANFVAWRDAVADCVREAAAGVAMGDEDRVATLVLTTMEGGVMLALTARSIEPFDHAVAELRHYLNARLGDAKG